MIAWELPRESICQKAGEGVDSTVVHEAKADTVIGAEAVHADLVEEAAELGGFEQAVRPAALQVDDGAEALIGRVAE